MIYVILGQYYVNNDNQLKSWDEIIYKGDIRGPYRFYEQGKTKVFNYLFILLSLI